MSLTDPPHMEPRLYVKCTCGTKGLYHHELCAVLDPKHPSWDAARDAVDRNARAWFGVKGAKR